MARGLVGNGRSRSHLFIYAPGLRSVPPGRREEHPVNRRGCSQEKRRIRGRDHRGSGGTATVPLVRQDAICKTENSRLIAVRVRGSRKRALNATWVGTLRITRSKPMGGRDLRGNEIGSSGGTGTYSPSVNSSPRTGVHGLEFLSGHGDEGGLKIRQSSLSIDSMDRELQDALARLSQHDFRAWLVRPQRDARRQK